MRIIVNDRVLFRPLTGVGHYARELLGALAGEDAAIDVRGFLSGVFGMPKRGGRGKTEDGKQTAGRYEDGGGHAARTADSGVGGGLRRWVKPWLRQAAGGPYRMAFRVAARRYSLYHEPNHVPTRCHTPTVTTIHDLSVLVHPEWHPSDRVRWYERDFDAGVRQTCRFIAVSEFTKSEMVTRLGIPAERIDVTYQAPRPAFVTFDQITATRVRVEHNLPEQFFLFVGTLEPRKNVAGLLEAYGALSADLRRRFPLVLAGGWGWKMDVLPGLLARHGVQNTTRLLGYLSDDALAGLYTTCTALVWPTLFEGFGLPPLEAMACGCPVIVSGVTSLPEVVGDAGVLLDPHDLEAWTEAMRRMAEDADWREQWQQRGRERAGTFSWQRCARQTIACYEAALRSSRQ